jgi:hypothetical protein
MKNLFPKRKLLPCMLALDLAHRSRKSGGSEQAELTS